MPFTLLLTCSYAFLRASFACCAKLPSKANLLHAFCKTDIQLFDKLLNIADIEIRFLQHHIGFHGKSIKSANCFKDATKWGPWWVERRSSEPLVSEYLCALAYSWPLAAGSVCGLPASGTALESPQRGLDGSAYAGWASMESTCQRGLDENASARHWQVCDVAP